MLKNTLSLLFALVVPMAASAAVTLTPLGGDQFQVAFDPMSFTVATGGQPVAAVVFEDFYASTAPSCGGPMGGSVQTSVNGSPIQGLVGNACTGAFNALNDVDGNDLLVTIYSSFLVNFGSVSVGDTVAVSTGTYLFSLPGLDATANAGPFVAFLVDNDFNRISNFQTTGPAGVPEPGSLLLMGLSLAGLAAARQRRRSA